MRGKFITIYGINNIGKSTHAKLLVDRLNQEGYKAVYVKYPIYYLKPTGQKINEILRSGHAQTISEQELQTLFMQNRLDFEPKLKQMLDEGTIVVAEDYSGTGIAWGTAKGVDQTWMEDLNKSLMKEDFSILMAGNRGLEAKEFNHIHEKDDELIKKVDQVLKSMAKKYDWRIVNVEKEIAQTAGKMWMEVKEFLASENF